MSFKIKSGHSLISSSNWNSPDNKATVPAPAAFPARISLTESPTIMQLHISTSNAFIHSINASGDGFGQVPREVTTWVKYFDMPKHSSSFMTVCVGT